MKNWLKRISTLALVASASITRVMASTLKNGGNDSGINISDTGDKIIGVINAISLPTMIAGVLGAGVVLIINHNQWKQKLPLIGGIFIIGSASSIVSFFLSATGTSAWVVPF